MSKKIKEYKAILEYTTTSLSLTVNKYLKDGWVLYGNLVIDISDESDVFAQALVQYEEDDDAS